MARKIRAAGGMFTFVCHGLGRALGLVSGLSWRVAYTLFGVSLIGGFAAFAPGGTSPTLRHGRRSRGSRSRSSRSPLSAARLLRRPDLGEVLGVALIGELLIILTFRSASSSRAATTGVSSSPRCSWNAFQGLAAGLGLFLAFWSWVGFEAAPELRGGVARTRIADPDRRVLAPASFVGVLYTLGIVGVGHVRTAPSPGVRCARAPGSTTMSGRRSGRLPQLRRPGDRSSSATCWGGDELLIITGSFACAMAFNNAGAALLLLDRARGDPARARSAGRTRSTSRRTSRSHPGRGRARDRPASFWFASTGPRSTSYYRMAVQGVVWIVLASRPSARWRCWCGTGATSTRTRGWSSCCARIAISARCSRIYLLFKNISVLAGTICYVGPDRPDRHRRRGRRAGLRVSRSSAATARSTT